MRILKYFNLSRDQVKIVVVLLLIILVSDECFWFSTANIASFSYVKLLFLAVLPVYLYKFKTYYFKNDMREIFIMFFLWSATALISGSNVLGGPLLLFLVSLSACLFVRHYSLREYSFCFAFIMRWLSVFTIVVWALVYGDILPIEYHENTSEYMVKTALGCTFFNDTYGVLLRNGGLFREPGIFMVFINTAFILEAFVIKKKFKIYELAIYALTITSTLSTAGVIILGLAYLLYLKKNTGSAKSLFVPLLFLVFAIFLLVNIDGLVLSIFTKLTMGTDSASTSARLYSITIPTDIMINNPILGCGVNAFESNYIASGKRLYHESIDPTGTSTNTIFNAGAIYGIWFFLYIIHRLFSFSKKVMGGSSIPSICMFLLFSMIYSNENMLYSIPLYIILWYSKSLICNKKL